MRAGAGYCHGFPVFGIAGGCPARPSVTAAALRGRTGRATGALNAARFSHAASLKVEGLRGVRGYEACRVPASAAAYGSKRLRRSTVTVASRSRSRLASHLWLT